MIWIDLIVVLILAFSFFAGLKGGAINGFFSLLIMIIAIAVAGNFYSIPASWLSFLPGQDWENFLGFFIAFVIVSIILSLLFWIPRHFINFAWNSGCVFRILGGIFTLVSSALGLALLVTLFKTFPISPWLNDLLADTTILSWITENLNFVWYLLLPEAFQSTPTTY